MCNNVSIIAAIAKNYTIGKNNKLLCSVPGDLKRFKELTTGHAVVMGRHTLESLPNGPLPNRKNIVITTMPEQIVDGCLPADSINDALELAGREDEIFIIGGGSIYKQSIALANKLLLTWIDHEFEGDTFFPAIDFSQWRETFREDHPADEKFPYSYSFVNYERIK
jgi:dihydrofolate reductase